MKVHELIKQLQALPQEAEVEYIYDGYINEPVAYVWLSNGGQVKLVAPDRYVDYEENWPVGVHEANAFGSWNPAPSIKTESGGEG